jgi:glycosyltransferase involved in cell wall biosynthesis
MKPHKFIATVDLDLLPLSSGIKPYNAYSEFPKARNLKEEFIISSRRLWKILTWAKDCEVMVLDSVSGRLHPDLLACVFMRLLPKRPVIIMADDMWNKGGFVKYFLQKAIIQLADTSINRYAVHSLGEGEIFANLWKISPKKVRMYFYHFTFTNKEINSGKILKRGYIFAGGNPARNYEALLETARLLPSRKFIIATRMLNRHKNIPSNVTVVQVPHTEFIRLMREADMVITPLASGQTKSAGQQTYLNAMRMGKINIINGKDVLGVTDYIENYVNGIISEGTPESYAKAIEWVYNPINQKAVIKIEQMAQETVKQFTYERCIQAMMKIIQEAVNEANEAII